MTGSSRGGRPWLQPNLPGAVVSNESATASTQRAMRLDQAGTDWQNLRVEMRVPPGTRYLMLSVHVADCKAGREPWQTGAVEFPGQFMDDFQVSLVRDAATR